MKGYKRRLRLFVQSKLDGKNKITAINAGAVTVFRYGAGTLQWKESEFMERYSQRGMWTNCI